MIKLHEKASDEIHTNEREKERIGGEGGYDVA